MMNLDKDLIAVIVGKKLRDLRERDGVSQQDLSAHLQISRPTLIAYENGKQSISVAEAYLAADYFKVDISELIPRLELIKQQTSIESVIERKGIVGDALKDVASFIAEINKDEK